MEEAKTNPLGFKINIRGDDVRTHSDSVFIPVDVFDGADKFLMKHEVALRSEFYNEIRTLPDWIEQVHKICAARVKEFLKSQEKSSAVPILDKMALFDAPEVSITRRGE